MDLDNSQRMQQKPPIILSGFESPNNGNKKYGHMAR